MMHHRKILRGLMALVLVSSVAVAALGPKVLTSHAAPPTSNFQVAAVGIGAQGLLAAIDVSSPDTSAKVAGSGQMRISMVDKTTGIPSYLYNGSFTVSSVSAVRPIKPIIPKLNGLGVAEANFTSPFLWDDYVFVKFNQAGDTPLLQINCNAQHMQLDFPVKLGTALSSSAKSYLNTSGGLTVLMPGAVVPNGLAC